MQREREGEESRRPTRVAAASSLKRGIAIESLKLYDSRATSSKTSDKGISGDTGSGFHARSVVGSGENAPNELERDACHSETQRLQCF